MKKLISLLLAAVILLSLGTAAFASEIKLPVYADVAKGSWYEGYVNQMVKAGLMNGVSETKFDPNGTLSREMFVTILYRAAGKPATGKASSFTDVVKGNWSADGIDWAASSGVVNGVTALDFAPKASLTREQMVTILYRWSKAEKADASALDAFPDKADVSEYAVDAFAWAVKNNVIGGKNGKLEPKGTTTRAEACAVLARYLETIAPTREDLEKAVMASAWAYFAKVGKLQYCSEVITELSKFYGGQYRLSEGAVPEDGTSDTTIYSVCSDFCCKTFTDGIGIRVFDSPDYLDAITAMFWSLSDSYGTTLIRYASDSYEIGGEAAARGMTRDSFSTVDETKAFLSNWKENLRPGDVMVVFVSGGGHAMLYIGNGYMIDCRGSKYNMTTGAEAPEPQGAVYLLYKIEDVLVTGEDKNWSGYSIEKLDRFTAVRPINQLLVDDGDGDPANDKLKNGFWVIPAGSATREENPLLDIDRTVSITPFGTAYTGEELTYSVKLRNYSDCDVYKTVCERSGDSPKDYTDLRVTERVPAGTELVPGSITNGGTAENGVITWNVNVPQGQTVEVSYKVKVTAFQGEMIVANGGFVGDIPSNTIKTYVGGTKLSAEAQSGLKKLADTPVTQWRETYNISALAKDTEFAERVYAKGAGVDLQLPTAAELLSDLFRYKSYKNKSLSRCLPYTSSTQSGSAFYMKDGPAYGGMLVPNYVGGYLTLVDHKTQINEFKQRYLEPGDILVYLKTNGGKATECRMGVAVGDGRILQQSADGHITCLDEAKAEAFIWKAFTYDVFFVLRPSLVDGVKSAYVGPEPTYGEEPVFAEDVYTPLSDENKAKLSAMATADTKWSGKNTPFAESVYKMLGIDLKSVTKEQTMMTFVKSMFRNNGKNMETGSKYQYTTLLEAPEGQEALWSIFLDGYRGGPYMLDVGLEPEPTFDKLEIGDVLCLAYTGNSTYWTGVKLTDSKMIFSRYTKDVSSDYHLYDFSGEKGAAEYAALLKTNPELNKDWNFYLAYRPAQAFTDINTGKAK